VDNTLGQDRMSGDIEIDDLEVSDGGSENDYSDHEHDPDSLVKEEDENADMAEQKIRPDGEENGNSGGTAAVTKPKFDPKDPLRPRRKKARRACFACQRAHLTCGMFLFSLRCASVFDIWIFLLVVVHRILPLFISTSIQPNIESG
jgi:hypothetical protein